MSSQIKRISEGLIIFQKYPNSDDVMAEHDIIYAGPSPTNVIPEDLARLAELGWADRDGLDNFQFNV